MPKQNCTYSKGLRLHQMQINAKLSPLWSPDWVKMNAKILGMVVLCYIDEGDQIQNQEDVIRKLGAAKQLFRFGECKESKNVSNGVHYEKYEHDIEIEASYNEVICKDSPDLGFKDDDYLQLGGYHIGTEQQRVEAQ